MAMDDGSVRCFSPDPRGIIPLDDFHVPHGTRRILQDPDWDIRSNTAFDEVIAACARRKETWISPLIQRSYATLHRLGLAHSLEVWRSGKLVGGLYGVQLGAAFFGESMFHTYSGASKVALVRLVERLRAGGFQLLDTQWVTPHLQGFGAVEIPRALYLQRLAEALEREAVWE